MKKLDSQYPTCPVKNDLANLMKNGHYSFYVSVL